VTAMQMASRPGSRRRSVEQCRLTACEDASLGATNPDFRPRSGNISSDTRAGSAGRSEPEPG